MSSSVVTTVLGVVALTCLAALVTRPFTAVSEFRLARFARRQCLVLTPDNTERVVDYLATTRRWRAGGMVVALAVAATAYAARQDDAPHALPFAIVGWLAGAVVAEWRIGVGRRGGVRRAALLAPRRLTDYVGRVTIGLVGASYLAVLCAQVVAWVELPLARWTLTALIGGTLLAAAVFTWVVRRILDRPQSVGPRDLLLADDALRSRSLHVLLGCASAIAGVLAIGTQSYAVNRVASELGRARLASHNPYLRGPDASWSVHSAARQYRWLTGVPQTGLLVSGLVLVVAGVLLATATFRAGRTAAQTAVAA